MESKNILSDFGVKKIDRCKANSGKVYFRQVLALIIFIAFYPARPVFASGLSCTEFYQTKIILESELYTAQVSHSIRGEIFKKIKELVAENKSYSDFYRASLNSEFKYEEVKNFQQANLHRTNIINLSKETSELIAVELKGKGYGVEVFQPSAAKTSSQNWHPFRVRVISFPQNKAGKFWRNLQRRFGHELIFDVTAEITEGRRGGVDEKYLYHTVNSILADAPERSVTLFHEIIHLVEREKIRTGNPSNFSMEFRLESQDVDLPSGYRRWFTLDEILAAGKEFSLYSSNAYKNEILKSEIFGNLQGEALEKKLTFLKGKIYQFSHWSAPRLQRAKTEVSASNFVLGFDSERGANYALVDILTYKKSWIPWKNLVKKHGDIKIFLSPEIATADRKIIQQHLIERLSATENELSLRVSN